MRVMMTLIGHTEIRMGINLYDTKFFTFLM